jgi:hypothetical protein
VEEEAIKEMMEGMNSTMKYCKNFCKCHNVCYCYYYYYYY